MNRDMRRNPDLLGDALLVGIVVGAAVIGLPALTKAIDNAANGLKLPTIPSAPGIGLPVYLPGGSGYVAPNPTTVSGPGSYKDLSTLNADIDSWFFNANGFLGTGLGSYDPTNWNDFRNKMITNPATFLLITYNPATFPTSPTTYYLQKSNDWALAHQSVNPYGTGYHG